MNDDAYEFTLRDGQRCVVSEGDRALANAYMWKLFHGYVVRASRDMKIYLHRTILCACSGGIVDHINGDPLDNRRSNLRVVDPHVSALNRGLQSNNTRGYRGVTLHKQTGRWQAAITLYGKDKYLGLFDTPAAAARAYNEAAMRAHGPEAKLNLVPAARAEGPTATKEGGGGR